MSNFTVSVIDSDTSNIESLFLIPSVLDLVLTSNPDLIANLEYPSSFKHTGNVLDYTAHRTFPNQLVLKISIFTKIHSLHSWSISSKTTVERLHRCVNFR